MAQRETRIRSTCGGVADKRSSLRAKGACELNYSILLLCGGGRAARGLLITTVYGSATGREGVGRRMAKGAPFLLARSRAVWQAAESWQLSRRSQRRSWWRDGEKREREGARRAVGERKEWCNGEGEKLPGTDSESTRDRGWGQSGPGAPAVI